MCVVCSLETVGMRRVSLREHMELPGGQSSQLYCFLGFSNCGADWVLRVGWFLIKIRPLISEEMKNTEFGHGKHFTFPLDIWDFWIITQKYVVLPFWWFDETIHFKQYSPPPFIKLECSLGHCCLIWKTAMTTRIRSALLWNLDERF